MSRLGTVPMVPKLWLKGPIIPHRTYGLDWAWAVRFIPDFLEIVKRLLFVRQCEIKPRVWHWGINKCTSMPEPPPVTTWNVLSTELSRATISQEWIVVQWWFWSSKVIFWRMLNASLTFRETTHSWFYASWNFELISWKIWSRKGFDNSALWGRHKKLHAEHVAAGRQRTMHALRDQGN